MVSLAPTVLYRPLLPLPARTTPSDHLSDSDLVSDPAPTLDAALEPALDPVPGTDPALDPVSDPDPSTDPALDPVPVPGTDPVLDPISDPALDPISVPALIPISDPASDPDTDTDPVTVLSGEGGDVIDDESARSCLLVSP